jgi:hypothetical protein
MKAISLVFLFVSIVLFCATAASAVGTGCITAGSETGTRGDKIFYTDCFDWVSGDGKLDNGTTNNDRVRLQTAIDTATKSSTATGRLVFNEDEYYVDGTLYLNSYSVLEGNGSAVNKSATAGTNIKIRLMETEDNTPLLFIGSGIHDVSIRNLGLVYYWVGAAQETPPTNHNSIAIKAEAANMSTPNSTGFQFDHLRVAYFTKGIYINSTGDGLWQFDNNHVQDSSFELCDTAIHLNTGNTGWHLNNIVFASEANQSGLYIQKVGYININLLVGNGKYNEDQTDRLSNEFIRIEAHGFVNIHNANGEAYKKNLIINTPNSVKSTPIVITNSDFQECHYTESGVVKPSVVITNGTVLSQGNSFACSGKVARPAIEGNAEIYSTGDKFCFEGQSQCFDPAAPFVENTRSGWAIHGTRAMVRTDGVNNPSGSTDDVKKAFVDLTTTFLNGDLSGPYKPFLSFTNSYYDPTLDTFQKWRYTFTRDASTGRLVIDADLNGAAVNPPSAGYYFKGGPVQLHRVPLADISAGYYNLSSGDKGAMLYCYDCAAGTSPCTGSGGGALAIRIESGSWACK